LLVAAVFASFGVAMTAIVRSIDRRHRLVAFAALLAAAVSCASSTLSGVDEPDFGEVVRHYRTLGSTKALALATEANGRWAYGARFASGTRERAIEDALRACSTSARSGGMRARCLLFAVENEPAPETVKGCFARKITSRRCAMQRRHQGALTKP
jgi:hypothetical protein